MAIDWINIKENTPEKGLWLLVFSSDSGRHIAFYNGKSFQDRGNYKIKKVTHWMVIPEPPAKYTQTT